ncbi:MAG: type II secretion system F family protein [Cumulibacter sp.]
MSLTIVGAGLGFIAAVGLLLIIFGAPPMRRPSLADRIAPFVREQTRSSRLLALPQRRYGSLRQRITPRTRSAVELLDRWVGGSGSVRRRLDALDDARSVEDIRFEQVIWGALGVAGGAALGVLITLLSGQVQIASALLLAAAGAVGGVLGRDWWLTVQVRKRDERIIAEFPVVAELLALVVTAGESPQGALARVARLVGGELGRSLESALADTRAGMPITDALEKVARTSNLEPLSRFIDGIVIALERGTPLAEVLRAQAADVREQSKRHLLERGARNELSMMIPVVFLLLPTTVILAMFPGLFSIVQLSQ